MAAETTDHTPTDSGNQTQTQTQTEDTAATATDGSTTNSTASSTHNSKGPSAAPTPRQRPALASLFTDHFGQLAVRCLQIIAVLIVSAAVVYALVQLKLVVIPLLIALILASALSPVIRSLRNRGLSAGVATWITLLGGIVVFGGIITLIVFAVSGQWDELSTSTSQGIDKLQQFVQNGPLTISQEQVDSARDSVVGFLTSSQFGTGAIAGVSAAGSVITGAVLAIVILFFFLKDGDRIWAFFLRPFRGERLERGQRVGRVAVRTFGGYVRGTATVAFVDALFIGVGVAVLGVPLALPLAVVVFLTAFIPIIGATLAGILAALVALVTNGPVVALIVVAIVILVNQLEGNLLQPVIMANSLKLHPLVILVALTAGTVLGGIVGAVLAVPIAAVAWAIVTVWNHPEQPEVRKPPFWKRSRTKQAPDAGPSPSAA